MSLLCGQLLFISLYNLMPVTSRYYLHCRLHLYQMVYVLSLNGGLKSFQPISESKHSVAGNGNAPIISSNAGTRDDIFVSTTYE